MSKWPLKRLLLRRNKHLCSPTPPHIPLKTWIFQTVWANASRHIMEQTMKSRTGKCWMGSGHWVTDTSATVRQCFSHFIKKIDCWIWAELIMPWGSSLKWVYLFSLLVKVTLLVDFYIVAVRIEQCMQLDRELWLAKIDMAISVRYPASLKFSTACTLHSW